MYLLSLLTSHLFTEELDCVRGLLADVQKIQIHFHCGYAHVAQEKYGCTKTIL